MTPVLEDSVRVHPSWATEQELGDLWTLAVEHQGDFDPSGAQVPGSYRKADILFLGKHRFLLPLVDRVWKRAEERAIADYGHTEWTPTLKRGEPVAPQITRSGNGQFFKPHTDNGNDPRRPRVFLRSVTYVLYLSQPFAGGDLVIHPTKLISIGGGGLVGKPATGQPLRIRPQTGTLVTFPSCLRHEIEPVDAGPDWEQGRITLNGWITRKQAEPGVLKKALQKARLGDKVAAVTRAAGIRECGGCKRRRAKLNGE